MHVACSILILHVDQLIPLLRIYTSILFSFFREIKTCARNDYITGIEPSFSIG